ncbi:unannotated protein [freshwater metagenome]|uniref:Unannotated protein n=1 Tax=freshwater metagenome TaxID=449393 RepID=A0A6J6Z499_9ZZZZ
MGECLVQQARHDFANVVFPSCNCLRRKATSDQTATHLMDGIIQSDDGRIGRNIGPIASLVLVGVDEESFLFLYFDDVRMSRNAPEFVGGVPVHRSLLTHPRIGGVRIVDVEISIQKVN